MLQKRKIVIFATVVLTLSIVPAANAAYFVFSKKGNIRSGPGTKYRVIGQLAKETIAEIPASFTDYEAKWIAIDAKTEIDTNKNIEKEVHTKWVHRSLGVVIKGDMEEVDKYFAIKESGWPKKMQELVLAGKVELGMSTHMVFYAWGRPDSVKEITTSDSEGQQWVYKKPGIGTQYLYFENGLLRSIEE